MKERLQKLLSARGVASRRRAEEMIAAGRVTVNGKAATLGDGADPETDMILIDGSPLPETQQNVYILLNKPRGFVTTLSDEKGRDNVTKLVQCGTRVYPVGRLDMDSEGLLLLTNDGAFANALMHPKGEVDKTYLVWVRDFTPEKEALLRRPIVLDDYQIRPPEVKLRKSQNDRAQLEVAIHEGRNRQIRRMCRQAGMIVTRLKRIQEGSLCLGNLPLGQWRYLTEQEVKALLNED